MARMLLVVTTDLATNTETNRRMIDHDDDDARKWLGKHCYWAFRNNHSVYTAPVHLQKAAE